MLLNMTIIKIYYLLFQKKVRLYLIMPMNKMYITFKSKDMFNKNGKHFFLKKPT